MKKAFDVMSDLVAETVQSLSEVITEPSTINVDFADLKKIIDDEIKNEREAEIKKQKC